MKKRKLLLALSLVLVPRRTYPTIKGIQMVLDEIATRTLKAKAWRRKVLST
jgi:hypothetical protein